MNKATYIVLLSVSLFLSACASIGRQRLENDPTRGEQRTPAATDQAIVADPSVNLTNDADRQQYQKISAEVLLHVLKSRQISALRSSLGTPSQATEAERVVDIARAIGAIVMDDSHRNFFSLRIATNEVETAIREAYKRGGIDEAAKYISWLQLTAYENAEAYFQKWIRIPGKAK